VVLIVFVHLLPGGVAGAVQMLLARLRRIPSPSPPGRAEQPVQPKEVVP
jgi:hypothetical protein